MSDAGDINGDGFTDVIIGAFGAEPTSPNSYYYNSYGASYVVFGKASGFAALTHLSDLDGNNGFRLDGTVFSRSGSSVSKVGDINGDGFDDVIIGAPSTRSPNGFSSGSSYVVFGKASGFDATLDLISLTGNDGFRLDGIASQDGLGSSVSAAGDVNGDGFDDVIIHAHRAAMGGYGTGSSYVIFGKDSGFDATLDLLTLDGSNGFRLDGWGYDRLISTSEAGDVNGDGFDDVIIGFPAAGGSYSDIDSGLSYVIFGKASGFDTVLHPSNLDGSNGFRLEGRGNDKIGYSISGGGDINGDGFDDVIVGAPRAFIQDHYTGSGVSYVLFSKASKFDATVNMSSLDGANGFRLIGGEFYDLSGYSASVAGDVNGDGLDDLIIGASVESRGVGAGSSYIVFGRTSGFEAEIDLSDLDGSNGFRLNGVNDHTGRSVSNAGDVNGDGFSDLIIGAQDSCYIVFGKASGFAAEMDLTNLDGSNGFRLAEVTTFDDLGKSVSRAGDINGDGFDDVIVGASGADPNGMESGSSYVIFGKASGFSATMDLSKLDGTNGFRLDGTNKNDSSGSSVSGAGDINGDGFDELMIGAPFAGMNGNSSGASYVVFGKSSGFSATLALADLDGKNGFRVDGLTAYDRLETGRSAGDINGDGFDDLILGAAYSDSIGIYSGSSYVIFGSPDFGKKDLPEIIGTPGDDVLRGTSAAEVFEGGDGIDLLIGRGGADIFYGGAGVDHIKVPDLAFQRIDGGSGNDVLHLDGKDLNLDLTVQGDQLSSIETICIYGRGDNTLSLTADDVINLSGTTDILKLHGNTNDHVTVLDKGWVDDGVTGYYHKYTNGEAVLLVGAHLTIDFVA